MSTVCKRKDNHMQPKSDTCALTAVNNSQPAGSKQQQRLQHKHNYDAAVKAPSNTVHGITSCCLSVKDNTRPMSVSAYIQAYNHLSAHRVVKQPQSHPHPFHMHASLTHGLHPHKPQQQ